MALSGYDTFPVMYQPLKDGVMSEWGLLKTTLRAVGGRAFKHWDRHLAKALWLVNTRWASSQAGLAQSKFLCIVEVDKAPVMHVKNMLE